MSIDRTMSSTPPSTSELLRRSDVEQSRSKQSRSKQHVSLRQFLLQDVDPKEATGPLAFYCFMTGYIDIISFSAIFVWCGFQTGNFTQLAIALARLFEGPPGFRDTSFHIADQQALCSLLSFQLGSFFGRLGDKIGPHKRIWLLSGTFMQACFTMAGALAFWKSGQLGISGARDPTWTNALTFVGLALISASLGLQGILGKRLNTQFGTTLVLTTVWVELLTDSGLFKFNRRVMTRDHRLIAVVALFTGAFAGRAILGRLGTAGALGVGTGFRVLIAFYWLSVPSKKIALS